MANPSYIVLKNEIHVYSEECLPYFIDSANILKAVRKELEKYLQVGITTSELDKIAEDLIIKYKALPLFKGHKDSDTDTAYPYTLCVSNNDELVHGIPNDIKLKNGDVLSLDLGVKYKNFCSDSARTYIIGKDINNNQAIINIGELAFNNALLEIKSKSDPTIGDIGFAINKTMILNPKYTTYNRFTGHGIGLLLHEAPIVPNIGLSGKGPKLITGMCFCIEPVVIEKNTKIIDYYKEGIIQFKTSNGSVTSHYENQIYYSKVDGFINLTSD